MNYGMLNNEEYTIVTWTFYFVNDINLNTEQCITIGVVLQIFHLRCPIFKRTLIKILH